MRKAWESFIGSDQWYEWGDGRAIKRAVLLLPGKNLCDWYLRTGKGCLMCGYNAPGASKRSWTWVPKFLFPTFLNTLYRVGMRAIRNERPETLVVYNGGSFLNGGDCSSLIGTKVEIPWRTQEFICRQVAKHPSLQRLFVESLPQFIHDDNISRLKELLGGKDLLVGIGLESANDHIRNRVIRKGFSRLKFERAVAVLHRHGARVLAYVFFKPQTLSEQEAIDDTIATIRYCADLGVDEVSISCAFVHGCNEMRKMWQRGEYRPPWLWSIIKILRETTGLPVHVRCGTFQDDPPPVDVPRNCSQCTDRITAVIEEYRRTYDLSLFDGLACECQQEWERELEKPPLASLPILP